MKLLILGYGSIGKRHAGNFSEFADVAVYDKQCDVVKDFPMKVFNTLEAALQWQPDGVIVSTPHDTHIEMAMQALESNAHVLVEKPISNVLDGVPRVIELAHEKSKKLHVVCNMRFHSAIEMMKDNIERIGKPLFARAYYGNYLPNMRPDTNYRALYAAKRSQGGGVILDAIHEIDYLRWFFGEVKSVVAQAGKLSDLDIDVEDYASIQLHHKNNVRSEIHLDYLQRCKRRGCDIVGDLGTLVWKSVGKKPEYCQVSLFSSENNAWETLYENRDEPVNKSYQTLAEHFVQAMSQDVDILANGDDGFRTLHIALASLESVQTKRWVEL